MGLSDTLFKLLKIYLFGIFISLFLVGCKKENQSNQIYVVEEKRLSITSIDKENSSFIATKTDRPEFIDNASLPSKALCDIEYKDGNISFLSCHKISNVFDDYLIDNSLLLNHEWKCKGLDGFGGRNKEVISKLVFTEDNRFSIKHSKKDSDSIWFAVETEITGQWKIVPNVGKIKLLPDSIHNVLIDSINAPFDDAPNFMTSPEVMNILFFNENEFNGQTTVHRSEKHIEENDFICRKVWI